MYTIQFNDGRISRTDVIGEARFYAWLSIDYSICNVFKTGGCILLSPYDF